MSINPIFFLFPHDYLRLFLFLLFIGLLLFIMLLLTFILSYKSSYKDVDKLASYECGFEPFEDTRATFDVQFYLIAIIFIVFDVEIAFLYPWIISLREFPSFNIFLPGFLFFIFVILGFIFEWYQGALDWKMSNLSKIQLFTLGPICFFDTQLDFYEKFFNLAPTTNVHYIIISVLFLCILGFSFLITLESTIIMYVIITLNLFFEKYYILFFIFLILLVVLVNFWLTLDNLEYNIDSKIIIVYNLYAVCTIFLVASANLFEIFLAMEGISLSLIILIAYKTQRFTALEAAIKYFVQSSIIGCFFSFSLSLLYFITGSFFLMEIFTHLSNTVIFTDNWRLSTALYVAQVQATIPYDPKSYMDPLSFLEDGILSVVPLINPLLVYAIITLSFCIFFKLSLFPVHFWTPDVYSGSPLIITTVFATVNKLIFFLVFFNIAKFTIFYVFFTTVFWKFFFSPLFQISALMSICIGAFGAYRQTTIKRFFGYTTINTLGFILFPIAVKGCSGFAVSLSYLIVYIFISLIFFTILAKIYNYKNNTFSRIHYISDLSGIYRINKLISFCLVFLILVFSGLPPYITFYNKYFILQFISNSAVNVYFIFIILVSTIITTFYYIRFVKSIFFEQPYVQQALVNLENNNFLLTQQLSSHIKKLVVTSNGSFETIIILNLIAFGPDIFEIVAYLA